MTGSKRKVVGLLVVEILKAINLCKEYRTGGRLIKAVDSVSFSVNQGEIFGFLGPNGAGKSTTINMLCTLTKPTSGSGVINNHDIINAPDSVRRSIGMVFQDPSLDEMLTAWENMDFHARLYFIPRQERRRVIEQMLKMVDLYDRKDDPVKTFSGGMKRRLEIARGLTHAPKVLFLDEPTLGLDPQTRNYIWEYIGSLRKEHNLTIFLTTHYMDEAEHCDRIAFIDNGRIISMDTPENHKKKLGGDVVSLSVQDTETVAGFLRDKYDLKLQIKEDKIMFKVKSGGEFLARLMRESDLKIDDISLRRPTLEDVFLSLTGRNIRDEDADGNGLVKAHMRMRRR